MILTWTPMSTNYLSHKTDLKSVGIYRSKSFFTKTFSREVWLLMCFHNNIWLVRRNNLIEKLCCLMLSLYKYSFLRSFIVYMMMMVMITIIIIIVSSSIICCCCRLCCYKIIKLLSSRGQESLYCSVLKSIRVPDLEDKLARRLKAIKLWRRSPVYRQVY